MRLEAWQQGLADPDARALGEAYIQAIDRGKHSDAIQTNQKIIIAGGGSIYLEKGISFWEEKKLSCGCPLQEVFCGFIKCAFIKVGCKETSGSNTYQERRKKNNAEDMRKKKEEERRNEERRKKKAEERLVDDPIISLVVTSTPILI